jgi:hypothetical protein
VDPKRDMDERLNIEGDPADVIRALFAIRPDETCEPTEIIGDPESGDEAINRLLADE